MTKKNSCNALHGIRLSIRVSAIFFLGKTVVLLRSVCAVTISSELLLEGANQNVVAENLFFNSDIILKAYRNTGVGIMSIYYRY